MKITKQQWKIIKTKKRIVEVAAYAGTGKTHTLVERVRYLIQMGIEAKRILVISFSNAAVDTLIARLPKGVKVKTFHAFGSDQVKKNWEALKYKQEPRLASKADELMGLTDAITATMKGLPKAGSKIARDFIKATFSKSSGIETLYKLFALKTATSDSLRDLTQLPSGKFKAFAGQVKLITTIYREWRKIRHARSLMDYTDMVQMGVKSLATDRHIDFEYLFVDEYQDCNAAQTRMLCALAKLIPWVMTFGDPFQSIFSFSGGRYVPLDKVLGSRTKYLLTKSFRLTHPNAKLGSAVVNEYQGENLKLLGNKDGEMPWLIKCESQKQQDLGVISLIKKLKNQGSDSSQIAILARTKAQLRDVEQALRKEGIASARLNHDVNDQHVLHVLEMVRQVERREFDGQELVMPNVVLQAVLKTREIPKSAMTRCLGKYKKVPKIASESFPSRYRRCIDIYLSLLGGRAEAKMLTVDSLKRWDAKSNDFDNAKAFIRYIKKQAASPKIVTSTIHSAKGREWDHVLVIGVTDGALPLFWSKSDEKLTEECNMMYVAITRAKKQQFLFHAPYDHTKLKRTRNKLSRFITPAAVRECLISKRCAILA